MTELKEDELILVKEIDCEPERPCFGSIGAKHYLHNGPDTEEAWIEVDDFANDEAVRTHKTIIIRSE